MMTTVPGTVWTCEHCGALREADGRCTFCGALEQPNVPLEIYNSGRIIPSFPNESVFVMGGTIEAGKTHTIKGLVCVIQTAEIMLAHVIGGPFSIAQLTIDNRLQLLLVDVPLSTDIINRMGYHQLCGDVLRPGSCLSAIIKNESDKDGQCFLYIHGVGVRGL